MILGKVVTCKNIIDKILNGVFTMAQKRKSRGLTFYEKEKKIKPGLWKEVFSYIFYLFMVTLIAFVLVLVFGMRVSTIGVSMEPTLVHGQEVLVNRMAYLLFKPHCGDIVVFKPNGNEKSHYYVKRVIAGPGDTVQIKAGKVYVNDEYLEEYQFDLIEVPGLAESPYLLGDNEFFVMGDNRNSSEDSRSGNIGAVHRDDIVGKVWFCFAQDNQAMGFVK